MLTFFTIPKPFTGQAAIHQANAIESWLRAAKDVEIMLCGDDEGVAEAANRHAVRHLSGIKKNEYGTPLVSDAFARAAAAASHRLLCYVNADILILSDFARAVRRMPFRNFMMVGQRYDLDLSMQIDFTNPDWERDLLSIVAEKGKLHPPTGSDYFVFPKDTNLLPLPPFAVGRPAWDNWLIYHAFAEGLPVINANREIKVIHQNHGYTHVPFRTGAIWEGPEADANCRLLGKGSRLHTLKDATFLLKRHWLIPAPNLILARQCWRAIRKRCSILNRIILFLDPRHKKNQGQE
jgi:hypothetical protein